jgi:hypothetical protein
MYRFEVNVQARPDSIARAESWRLEGCVYERLAVDGPLAPIPMSVSFEEAAERLQRLPRLFFEPDGSFVWVENGDGKRWQVDGTLYDRSGRLLYAELKGHCPCESFDDLLRAFGWPDTPVMFQLIRHAAYLDEGQFRRFATAT